MNCNIKGKKGLFQCLIISIPLSQLRTVSSLSTTSMSSQGRRARYRSVVSGQWSVVRRMLLTLPLSGQQALQHPRDLRQGGAPCRDLFA